MIVDIDVSDCQIRAFRPEMQTILFLPTDSDPIRMIKFNSAPIERLNDRELGTLRGRALRRAESIVNDSAGGVGMSGWKGSIEIDEKDFVKSDE